MSPIRLVFATSRLARRAGNSVIRFCFLLLRVERNERDAEETLHPCRSDYTCVLVYSARITRRFCRGRRVRIVTGARTYVREYVCVCVCTCVCAFTGRVANDLCIPLITSMHCIVLSGDHSFIRPTCALRYCQSQRHSSPSPPLPPPLPLTLLRPRPTRTPNNSSYRLHPNAHPFPHPPPRAAQQPASRASAESSKGETRRFLAPDSFLLSLSRIFGFLSDASLHAECDPAEIFRF